MVGNSQSVRTTFDLFVNRRPLANALTPMVGDVGARTPEFKSFLVNIEKL